MGCPGLRFGGWDRIRARRRRRVRCFRLLRWAGRTAIAKVLHLLRAQGTTGVDRLNRALLLGERWLNRRRWSFVDERARLVGRPWRGPLDRRRVRTGAEQPALGAGSRAARLTGGRTGATSGAGRFAGTCAAGAGCAIGCRSNDSAPGAVAGRQRGLSAGPSRLRAALPDG